jgi:hypothetical protein
MNWLWNHPLQLTQHMVQSPIKRVLRHVCLRISTALRAARFADVFFQHSRGWRRLRETVHHNASQPVQLDDDDDRACQHASSSRVSDALRKAVLR